jgi:hypothetical protein
MPRFGRTAFSVARVIICAGHVDIDGRPDRLSPGAGGEG